MSISVVIPSYNRAAFLLSTLDSILAQTRPPDEVLVVDDGSTDHTALVLRNYAPRVRHLRIANSGDLVARNTGLRAARCERVAFCDSDDLWAPDYLAAMCALWRAEPRLVAAYGDFVTVRNDVWEDNSKFAAAPPGFWHGVRKLEPDLAAFDEPVMDRLLAYQPFFVSCLVADRVFFLRIGGWDEAVSRTVGCDFATALRIAEHAPIGLLRRPLVGIRKHDGNYSADVQAMNLGDSLVLEHVLATRPAAAAHAALIRASIARRRRDALDTAFSRNDLAAVQTIGGLLSQAEKTWATRLKHRIATLPEPLGRTVAAAACSLGSARGRVSGGMKTAPRIAST